MTPRSGSSSDKVPTGTGTDGKITRDDLEARFRSIQGEVDTVEEEAMNYVAIAAAAVVVTVVVVVFLLGKRKGKRTRTVVEVRRL